MRFKQINELSKEEFRRLTGVKRSIFKRMIEILIEEEVKKKAQYKNTNNRSKEEQKNHLHVLFKW